MSLYPLITTVGLRTSGLNPQMERAGYSGSRQLALTSSVAGTRLGGGRRLRRLAREQNRFLQGVPEQERFAETAEFEYAIGR